MVKHSGALEMDTVDFLVSIAILFLIILGIIEYVIYEKAKTVAVYLTLAERDFNANLNSGQSHGGRKSNIEERREWNKMALPFEGTVPADVLPSLKALANVQCNRADYTPISHELINTNERELAGKSAAMGKASMTAFLLRELYLGNIDAAQQKIIAETRNNNGKTPYIAPGIDVIVGFDKFKADELRFEEGAGVDDWLLKRAVRGWKFPRDIRWLNDDKDQLLAPWVALGKLYQQNPPDWTT